MRLKRDNAAVSVSLVTDPEPALRAFEYGPDSGFAPERGQWAIGP